MLFVGTVNAREIVANTMDIVINGLRKTGES